MMYEILTYDGIKSLNYIDSVDLISKGYLNDIGGIFYIRDESPIDIEEWGRFSKYNVYDYVDKFAKYDKNNQSFYSDVLIEITRCLSCLNMGSSEGVDPERILKFIKNNGFYSIKNGTGKITACFDIFEFSDEISENLRISFEKNFPKTVQFSWSSSYKSNDAEGQIHTAYLYDQFSAHIWGCYRKYLKDLSVVERVTVEAAAFKSLRPSVEG